MLIAIIALYVITFFQFVLLQVLCNGVAEILEKVKHLTDKKEIE